MTPFVQSSVRHIGARPEGVWREAESPNPALAPEEPFQSVFWNRRSIASSSAAIRRDSQPRLS